MDSFESKSAVIGLILFGLVFSLIFWHTRDQAIINILTTIIGALAGISMSGNKKVTNSDNNNNNSSNGGTP